MIPEIQSYEDHQAELRTAQAGKSREQIAGEMAATSEAVFDPETVEHPVHNWVDRGLIVSCEGAGHPNHRVVKRLRK